MVEGYSIIDAHAHIFPDKIAEKATTGISKFYGLPMYHQTGSVKELLQSGKEDGVDGFLVCFHQSIPFKNLCGAFQLHCIWGLVSYF